MRRFVAFSLLLLVGFGLLTGCGQKGPLFLPPKPVVTPPAAATAAGEPAAGASAAIPAAASVAVPVNASSVADPATATSSGG